MRPTIALILALALSLANAAGAAAAPGQVEIAYGGKGSGSVDITPTLPSENSLPIAMAIGPRNETVVLAATPGPSSTAPFLSVRRFDSTGAFDAGFAARSGTVLDDTQHPLEYPSSRLTIHGGIAVQEDGKVVIASGGAQGVTLIRLGSDGASDATFGAAGRATASVGGPATVTSVAVRGDGSIVLAGAVANGFTSSLFLGRFTSAGQPDSTFGTGGFTYADLRKGSELPAGLALRGGKTFVGAPVCCGYDGLPLVLTSAANGGTFSPLFDRRTPPGLAGETPSGIAAVIPRKNGKLMVAGSGTRGSFVASYLRDGTPDPDFGRDGIARVRGLFLEGGSAAVRDRRGGVVLVGSREVNIDTYETSRALTIKRVKPSGRVDGLFGGARPNLVVEPRPGIRVGLDINRAIATAQQPNGRIVVLVGVEFGCTRGCPPPKFGLIRLFGAKSTKKPARCQGRVATIAGTPRGETLTGTPRPDVIAAFAGDDTVRGNGGNDLVCGGPGADTLSGGPGDDRLRGGPGRDSVRQ